MRVLTFTSLFPNAAQPLLGVFVYQRVAHLAQRPENVVQVVAPVPYFPSWLRRTRWHAVTRVPRQEQIGKLTIHHPRYFLLPKISMPWHGLTMFLGSLPLVLRLKKETKFDCIDAHYVYPDGFAAVLLGKMLRIPVTVSARGTDINLFPTFWLTRRMIRWTLRQAQGVIAVSAALKEAMVKLGASAEKIRVISNGVDVERFQPVERRAARRHLGLPEDARIVVSVSALIPTKGLQSLITAVAEMAPRSPKLKLYLVGDGALRGTLENSARKEGLEKQVFLVGNKPNEELKFWYSAADVTCLASLREGSPNVLLESMACGTPVVATRVGGVPEVIVSPELGVLVEPNSQALAAALEFALNKSWDREALVRHARARTWRDVAAEVERYLLGRV